MKYMSKKLPLRIAILLRNLFMTREKRRARKRQSQQNWRRQLGQRHRGRPVRLHVMSFSDLHNFHHIRALIGWQTAHTRHATIRTK